MGRRLSQDELHPDAMPSVHRIAAILTALAAMLAFIPLTHSVFWGTLAYALIGGTFGGTILTLVFLPALYAIWSKIKPAAKDRQADSVVRPEPVTA